MSTLLWFSPVCDLLLGKIAWWQKNYEKGEIHSTRQFLDPIQGMVDKPTRYLHTLAFTKHEFDHLVRILRELCPDKPLVEEFEKLRLLLPKSRMILGKQHVVELAFFPAHVQLVCDTLLAARSGSKPTTLAEQVEEEGKLF